MSQQIVCRYLIPYMSNADIIRSMTFLFSIVLLAFLVVLAWILAQRLPEEWSPSTKKEIRGMFPQHAQHFPQLRQSLASADRRYVQRKAPGQLKRIWRQERQQVLQAYLAGLAMDFARLERFTHVDSPFHQHFSGLGNWRLAWLAFRFRANYRVAWIALSTARLGSTRQIAHLTELVGDLSSMAGDTAS